jgi:DNA-binding transcriptional LysR family regulator
VSGSTKGASSKGSIVELRHLRLFVTLAEELHFGRAAVRLHLTQPSVSGQLRQLEDELGVQLIDRSARQIALTDVGASFLRDARRVVAQAEAAAGSVQRFQEGAFATIRVGYLHDAIPACLSLALRRTARHRPTTRLLLKTGSPHELVDDLRNDLLDLAVVSLPAPTSGLRVIPLGFEHAIGAVQSNLDRDDVAPFEVLAQRPLLTLARRLNPAFYDALIGGLQAAGLPGSLIEVDATSVEPLLMEAACGQGCALVPESVMLRQRPVGVSFRRLEAPSPVGCRMAVVASDTQWNSDLSALVAELVQPPRERLAAAA